MNAIVKAIECLGSQGNLAKACDISQSAISQYMTGSKRPSAEIAIRVEVATCGKVRAEAIRPDIPWHVIRNTEQAD